MNATRAATLNTERSAAKVAEFAHRGITLRRKVQTYEKRFSFPPEEVFPQLCPARELDWIDGWDCDLLYTSTGYVEPDCIFSTSESSPFGPGLWIFARHEPNRKLELVRTIGDAVVIHFRIDLQDNKDGTSTGRWHLTFTAVTETGNAIVDSLPTQDPAILGAIEGLEHFLRTGSMARRQG